jgi:prepilin-type N-terminal cleavage/methylation domain-containing protein
MKYNLLNKNTQKQSGFTIIEMSVALIIIAVAVGVATPIMYGMKQDFEAASAAKTVSSYFPRMAAKWPKRPFTGMDNDWAIEAGVPDEGDIIDDSVLNLWGYEMTFSAGTITGGVADGARQIVDEIVVGACIDYVNSIAPAVDELLVGTTVVKTKISPIETPTLTTACDVDSSTIEITMRKS